MDKHCIFLFDLTGEMAKPWAEAGYTCWIIDIQHPPAYGSGGITTEGNINKVHWDLSRPWLPPFPREQIAFVAAFPPCDHLAVSGARWFKGKGLRKLAEAVTHFATAAEFCDWSEAAYMIENPSSTISTYWRKPDFTFSPEQYTGFCLGDNYTKKTCLWTGGGFVMPPEFRAEGLPPPDDRIHKCAPGPDRANIRSKTPPGFAMAAFRANAKQRSAAA